MLHKLQATNKEINRMCFGTLSPSRAKERNLMANATLRYQIA
ncbi:MAG: hypothetical protein ACKO3K_08575 [Cuspidothrix sp.]